MLTETHQANDQVILCSGDKPVAVVEIEKATPHHLVIKSPFHNGVDRESFTHHGQSIKAGSRYSLCEATAELLAELEATELLRKIRMRLLAGNLHLPTLRGVWELLEASPTGDQVPEAQKVAS